MKISKIEVKNLWGKDIKWILNKDVNILVGKNGSGKSTVLRMLNETISSKNDIDLNYRIFDSIDEIIIELENNNIIRANSEERKIAGLENFLNLNVDYLVTFDTKEHSSDISQTLLDNILVGKDGLKYEFIRYQRNLSKSVEEIFMQNNHGHDKNKFEAIEKLYIAKNIFLRQINNYFSETGKIFDEENFNFKKQDISNPIEIVNLSSGEKQLLIILLTVLLQDQKPYVLIMDEPEISMHIEWQKSLITNILELNSNCQIIFATHSPTIFYKGWDNHFKRFEDISANADLTKQSSIIIEQNTQNQKILEYLKIEFEKVYAEKWQAKLYQFNNIINNIPSLTYKECLDIFELMKKKDVRPDIFTYTTLISKLTTYEEAEELFNQMKKAKIKPNEYTFNNLLKKAPSVEKGIEIIAEMKKSNVFPDIITFSTLLGKAKTINEINIIEEHRRYYGVQPNEKYFNKLKIKQ